MSLGVGVGLNNTKAVFEAIWCAIQRQAQRVRPHAQVRHHRQGSTLAAPRSVFTFKRLWLPILEIAFGVLHGRVHLHQPLVRFG